MGYLIAGYVITAAVLGGYVLSLRIRGRRALARAGAIAARRDERGGEPNGADG
jgi:hypothetical protein